MNEKVDEACNLIEEATLNNGQVTEVLREVQDDLEADVIAIFACKVYALSENFYQVNVNAVAHSRSSRKMYGCPSHLAVHFSCYEIYFLVI